LQAFDEVSMSDRKYQHRGYQEEARKEERRPAPEGPRERPEGPRGRGLGAPTATVFRCRMCGAKQEFAGTLASDATCAGCGNDLHTCSNCVHFDTSRPNECRKPVLQRITSKTKRNACELFTPNTVQEFGGERPPMNSTTGEPRYHDPRAAFDALFKKKK
jgi:hypothetical protein